MLIPVGFWAASGGGGGGGAGGNAMELISTQVLSSTSTSVTFSSIPSTFKHLQIRATLRAATSSLALTDLYLRFNGDNTSANYRGHILTANGTSVASSDYGSGGVGLGEIITSTAAASQFTAINIDILDYQGTKNKTSRALAGLPESTTKRISLGSHLWMSTATVSSLVLSDTFGSGFVTGSRFSLYGIKG
jgi:hypothetical protein